MKLTKRSLNMTRIKIILLLFITTICLSVTAQNSASPASWRMSVKMTSETEGVATIKAIITPGWHLYGTTLPKGGPKPTTFNFAGSKGVEFISDLTVSQAPKKVHDAIFNLDLNWWDTDVTFRRKFRVTNPADAQISATVNYMGCNDETCAPPTTKTLTKPIHIKK